MRLLIDTHVFIWTHTDVGKTSPRAAAVLADVVNDLYVSAVMARELAIKVPLGTLVLRRFR